jgi:hypothetical protein
VRTAKLFKNGQSQAVRLPKEFRFPGTYRAVLSGSRDWPAKRGQRHSARQRPRRRQRPQVRERTGKALRVFQNRGFESRSLGGLRGGGVPCRTKSAATTNRASVCLRFLICSLIRARIPSCAIRLHKGWLHKVIICALGVHKIFWYSRLFSLAWSTDLHRPLCSRRGRPIRRRHRNNENERIERLSRLSCYVQ